jgi:hypothetical protein
LDEDGFVTADDFYNIMTHKVYWDQWFEILYLSIIPLWWLSSHELNDNHPQFTCPYDNHPQFNCPYDNHPQFNCMIFKLAVCLRVILSSAVINF